MLQVRAPGRQLLGNFRQILDSGIEDIIANHALDMQQRLYGLTTTELQQMAFQVAEYKGVTLPFDQTKKMAGRHWLAGFLARNTLSIREPEATSLTWAVGFNKAQVDFEIRKSVLGSIGPIDGDRIWTMDERGLTVVHKPGRIIAKKGQKQVGKVTSVKGGKRSLPYAA